MEYIFKGKYLTDDESRYITIPFNVWEVCEDNIGSIPVRVTIEEKVFDCNLDALKNGYYRIPISKENAESFVPDTIYSVSFTIIGKEKLKDESDIYTYENPIRKIDDIKILIQPWDGLCGQTCFAMLAGVSIEEAGNIMHCREWQANVAKIVPSLDYVGIKHSNKIIYTHGEDVTLPECCLIMENLGRFSHYLIGFKGKYYDPNDGIMDSINLANVKGYLEILL